MARHQTCTELISGNEENLYQRLWLAKGSYNKFDAFSPENSFIEMNLKC